MGGTLPLRQKFGAKFANQVFLDLSEAVREMKKEEGSHAAHWRKDAECLGIRNSGLPLPTACAT
ncbi:MAG TPA: hypothetical protein VH020_16975 [Stellaceae bacterium]|jgi:hypothetical protein|nr:hypothetical protein [Stellaceae bacterium]